MGTPLDFVLTDIVTISGSFHDSDCNVHCRRFTNIPLCQAKIHRIVSGDIVVYAGTSLVVPVLDWLWHWEKEDPRTYAYQVVIKAMGGPTH